MHARRIVHLTTADVSLIVLQIEDRLPLILHWGARVEAADAELISFAAAEERPGLGGISDIPYRPSILPEHSDGWFGRPGVELHRAGAAPDSTPVQKAKLTALTGDHANVDRTGGTARIASAISERTCRSRFAY